MRMWNVYVNVNMNADEPLTVNQRWWLKDANVDKGAVCKPGINSRAFEFVCACYPEGREKVRK